MASLRPLSLRCIFYKGAVAGAGFHSLLSVCLGLRRCWVSVFGNVIVPLGSSMWGSAEASLSPLGFLGDFLCYKLKGKKG